MTQAFAGALTDYADGTGCPHLTPVIDRLVRPIRVAVRGRTGVGRRTISHALRERGVAVVAQDACDVLILVVAEAVKPEELAALRSAQRPALLVLGKADVAGSGPGGPMAVAGRRAAAIATATGWPTMPVVGLLAVLEPLGEELIDALRSFVAEPADLSGVDAFLDRPHPVGRELRVELVERLDRFGIAHAVIALAPAPNRPR